MSVSQFLIHDEYHKSADSKTPEPPAPCSPIISTFSSTPNLAIPIEKGIDKGVRVLPAFSEKRILRRRSSIDVGGRSLSTPFISGKTPPPITLDSELMRGLTTPSTRYLFFFFFFVLPLLPFFFFFLFHFPYTSKIHLKFCSDSGYSSDPAPKTSKNETTPPGIRREVRKWGGGGGGGWN